MPLADVCGKAKSGLSLALILQIRAIDKKRLEKKVGVLDKPVLQK
ncbi:MAG: hypothetical protein U1A28_05685, partial [Patescibacteria group bacterium]|nr:hypothetical protein [Patescibacteria group bacterium]